MRGGTLETDQECVKSSLARIIHAGRNKAAQHVSGTAQTHPENIASRLQRATHSPQNCNPAPPLPDADPQPAEDAFDADPQKSPRFSAIFLRGTSPLCPRSDRSESSRCANAARSRP